MILPGQFRLSDDAVGDSLHAGGFGHLVTPGPETLEVTSMPLLYNAEGNVLEGHLPGRIRIGDTPGHRSLW